MSYQHDCDTFECILAPGEEEECGPVELPPSPEGLCRLGLIVQILIELRQRSGQVSHSSGKQPKIKKLHAPLGRPTRRQHLQRMDLHAMWGTVLGIAAAASALAFAHTLIKASKEPGQSFPEKPHHLSELDEGIKGSDRKLWSAPPWQEGCCKGGLGQG